MTTMKTERFTPMPSDGDFVFLIREYARGETVLLKQLESFLATVTK